MGGSASDGGTPIRGRGPAIVAAFLRLRRQEASLVSDGIALAEVPLGLDGLWVLQVVETTAIVVGCA